MSCLEFRSNGSRYISILNASVSWCVVNQDFCQQKCRVVIRETLFIVSLLLVRITCNN